jgi:protein-S-isoprenylcysteine O-methyltransferase Ste14
MPEPTPAHPIIQRMSAVNDWLSQDFLGGPRLIKQSWVINSQKGGTFPFVLLLMWLYGNFSVEAWVYLALHGSYGLVWLLKHFAFRDRNWERRVTFGAALNAFLFVLGPYWVFPWLLISGVLGPRPPAGDALLAGAITLHTLGVVVMIAADCQKHFTLRYRRGLITEGMFRHIRHPNYLGEMMLYGAFALLVRHWIPWAILAWVWIGIFLVNMKMKEASMSRYPEWGAYAGRTGMLLPRLSALLGRTRDGSDAAPEGRPGAAAS